MSISLLNKEDYSLALSSSKCSRLNSSKLDSSESLVDLLDLLLELE